VLDPVFRALTESGNAGAAWLVLALLVAVYLGRWQVFAWVAVADGMAQFSTALIQRAVGRHRPRVHTLIAEPHSYSFPSGHTASSFACAVVLVSFAPRLRVPLYLLAALIGLSRAYVGVHYPLDVLGGALWGIVVGTVILYLEDARPVFPRRSAAGATGLRRRAGGRRRSRRARRAG
jgi:undecaprenyl-diphosphatase